MMYEPIQHGSSIAREAKGLTQGLKESLKKHEPWDREIEFQRANLRRQYLQLIFVHPYAKESKDADHSLWMTTSYYIIAAYKQRIAAADAVTQQSSTDTHNSGRHHGKAPGMVEHRKLVHRFRQFLAEEEKFWTTLIVRVVRVFQLDEARPTLVVLGISLSDLATMEGSSPSDRRTVFPAEDATTMPSPVQREQKLVMLSKALVCLGDIARYREHYNESGGRPRAGKDFHDDTKSSARGRGGRRGAVEQAPRPRNYSKAQECYERARLLVPDVGNACHQLAILANYQQDPFASVLQYYRAMCVKHPYETAAANLDSTLSRNLESYRITLAKFEAGSSEVLQSPKTRVERFKKSLVVLHGLWRLDPIDADTVLPEHSATVMTTFSSLVSERVLPTDVIWKTIVLALGALWRCRILRDPNPKRDNKHGQTTVEANILTHILGVVQTLLQIGNVQLTDASITLDPALNNDLAGNGGLQIDLAQNITAVFRRTLPALRIASKWIRVHFGYLGDATSRLAHEANPAIPTHMSEFWNAYIAFSFLLYRIFPLEKLPKMTVPLEEDVDVSGFTPLKRAMFDPNVNSPNGLQPGQSQVHPNEEQLMRIADLLGDALTISKFQNSPFIFENDRFIQRPSEPEDLSVVAEPGSAFPENAHASTSAAILDYVQNPEQSKADKVLDTDMHSEVDDDNATVSTRTEDDPVNLAMQAQLGSDDEDEMDEQVLYPKQTQPIIPSVSASNSFSTPSMRTKPLSPPKLVTAEDLVNEMMRPRGASAIDIRARPAGAQLPPPLLFGTGSPSAPTSIWSTSLDSTALSADNLRITGYPGAQVRGQAPALQTLGLRHDQNAPVPPLSPTQSSHNHQRQLSHPLTPPTRAGTWTSQASSPLGHSQSQSQQRHTLSPPLAPFVPQPPVVGSRNFHPAPPSHYVHLQPPQHPVLEGPAPLQFPQNNVPLLSEHQPLMSHNTWSYSGPGSLNGIGAPLGPFSVPLPYAHSHLQPQDHGSRPGAWAPS